MPVDEIPSTSTSQAETDETIAAVRKRRAGLRRAMRAVEAAAEAAAAGRAQPWQDRLRDEMVRLRDAFSHHCEETEAGGGLFAEVVEQTPRLANAVKRLEDEHTDIQRGIEAAVAAMDGRDPTEEEHIRAVRDAVTAVLARLIRHRQRGADLIYQAYVVDVGGET